MCCGGVVVEPPASPNLKEALYCRSVIVLMNEAAGGRSANNSLSDCFFPRDIAQILSQTSRGPLTNLSEASHKPLGDLSQTSRRPLTNLSEASHKPLGDLSQTSRRPLTNLSEASHKPLGDLSQTSRRPLGDLSQTSSRPLTNLSETSHKPLRNPSETSRRLLYGNAVEEVRWRCLIA